MKYDYVKIEDRLTQDVKTCSPEQDLYYSAETWAVLDVPQDTEFSNYGASNTEAGSTPNSGQSDYFYSLEQTNNNHIPDLSKQPHLF